MTSTQPWGMWLMVYALGTLSKTWCHSEAKLRWYNLPHGRTWPARLKKLDSKRVFFRHAIPCSRIFIGGPRNPNHQAPNQQLTINELMECLKPTKSMKQNGWLAYMWGKYILPGKQPLLLMNFHQLNHPLKPACHSCLKKMVLHYHFGHLS